MNLTFKWVQAIHPAQVDLLLDIYNCAKDHRRHMLLLDVLNIEKADGERGTHRMSDTVANEVLEKLGPIIKRVKTNAV